MMDARCTMRIRSRCQRSVVVIVVVVGVGSGGSGGGDLSREGKARVHMYVDVCGASWVFRKGTHERLQV